jgi:hypothetical protein
MLKPPTGGYSINKPAPRLKHEDVLKQIDEFFQKVAK